MMLQCLNFNVSTLDNNLTVYYMSNLERTFSIGTVARLVGVSTHVLRVWERRYDLNLSSRNDKGRRVYSAIEIEKLKLIKHALDVGYKISDIAAMSMSELTHLKESSEATSSVIGKTEKDLFLVYGERLSHWLFRSRSSINYRTLEDLHALSKAVTQSEAIPKGIILELQSITPELEELIYTTRLELPKNVGIWIVCNNLSNAARWRLVQANIEVVSEALEADSVAKLLDRLKGFTYEKSVVDQRTLSDSQLDELISLENPILCDCPKHLADIYIKVDEFFRYTNECEKLSPKDSAVHRHIANKLIQLRSELTELTMDVANMDGIKLSK